MKAAETQGRSTLFTGVLDVIAEALGRPSLPKPRRGGSPGSEAGSGADSFVEWTLTSERRIRCSRRSTGGCAAADARHGGVARAIEGPFRARGPDPRV